MGELFFNREEEKDMRIVLHYLFWAMFILGTFGSTDDEIFDIHDPISWEQFTETVMSRDTETLEKILATIPKDESENLLTKMRNSYSLNPPDTIFDELFHTGLISHVPVAILILKHFEKNLSDKSKLIDVLMEDTQMLNWAVYRDEELFKVMLEQFNTEPHDQLIKFLMKENALGYTSFHWVAFHHIGNNKKKNKCAIIGI